MTVSIYMPKWFFFLLAVFMVSSAVLQIWSLLLTEKIRRLGKKHDVMISVVGPGVTRSKGGGEIVIPDPPEGAAL